MNDVLTNTIAAGGVTTRRYPNAWIILLILFMTPMLSDLVRKFVPGQPNWITPVTGCVMTMWTLAWALNRTRRRPIPFVLYRPIFILIAFQLIYIYAGAFVKPVLPFASFALRILPELLGIVAYRSLRSQQDFHRIVNILAFIPLLITPVGITQLLFGASVLPDFLRPIEILTELGRDHRGGFEICSTFFSTAAVMAYSLDSIFYLTIASFLLQKQHLTRRRYLLVSLVCNLFMVFISTQRGIFFTELAGFAFLFFIQKRINIQTLIGLLLAVGVLIYADKFSRPPNSSESSSRSQLMLSSTGEFKDRLNGVFLWHVLYWAAAAPLGTYLGYSGMERIVFAPDTPGPETSVEVGAALFIVETGIVGLVIFTIMMIMLWYKLWQKASRRKEMGSCVKMLLFGNIAICVVFYFKATTVLSGFYLSQLFFWTIPGVCLAMLRKDFPEREI